MNRQDLRRLAVGRLDDARVLLANRRYGAAYYLCGYAVECGLKACIAQQIKRHTYPPRADFSQKLVTHNLEDLVRLANLRDSRTSQMSASPGFTDDWETVAKWNETARYENWTRADALALFHAVSDIPDGVLEWIKTHW